MKKIFLILFVLAATICKLNAQTPGDTIEIQKNEKGKIIFARFEKGENIKAQDESSILKNILQAKPDDDFNLINESTDEMGFTHKKFQQYYKGIKVDDAQYVTHAKGGSIKVINGDFKDVRLTSVNPMVTISHALEEALSFVNAKKYKWQDSAYEKFIKANTGDPNATYYPKGELVIAQDFSEADNKLKLAWKFVISTADPNNEQLIYIDANTGDIIRKQELICNTNTPGTAQTSYSGSRGIIGDSFTGGFRLRENRNSVNVQTLNLQKGTNIASAVDFTDNDNNWTAAEYNNANHDQAALDAHWGAEIVLDYWHTVFSRNSIDGNGLRIRNYVHFGSGVENAGWDPVNKIMEYGDGGTIFRPLTALDVCAHEFGHGVCQSSANLTNNVTQESAALNEGFSDIWGATIEHWGAPTKQTWLMGEDITLITPGYLRSLSNPHSSMVGEGDVDTYHGTNWYTGTIGTNYAHENMSVLTHWYFLLSQGGAGWNNGQTSHAPSGSGYQWNVSGIGIDDAARIAYRAETFGYLTSSSNYVAARNATIQAARDLFGTGSCAEIAVTNAWYAVGVGAAYSGHVSLSSIQAGCNSGSVTATTLDGNIYNWHVSGDLLINGTTTTLSTTSNTINMTGSQGGVYLTATLTCGVNVPGGIDYAPYLREMQGLYPEYMYHDDVSVGVTTNPNDSYYRWYVNNILVKEGAAPYANYYCSCEDFKSDQRVCGDNTIRVEVETSCGITTSVDGQFYWFCGYGRSNTELYPNPAKGQVTVKLRDINDRQTTTKLKNISEVRIIDKTGGLKKIYNYSTGSSSVSVNISFLPSDVYYIEVSDGKNKVRLPLSIQK